MVAWLVIPQILVDSAVVSTPTSENALMIRARALGGRTIAEVAHQENIALPQDPKRSKGFVGQLVDKFLGVTQTNGAAPDFPSLGIEVKTLPIDRQGRVKESTFVCSTPQGSAPEEIWEESRVYKKLARVLFILIESDRQLPFAHRRFGAAWLWTPSPEEHAILRADWEELSELVAAGRVEDIDATRGQVLQMRPKGANAAERTLGFDSEGAPIWAPRRAFYLRARFTRAILANTFGSA